MSWTVVDNSLWDMERIIKFLVEELCTLLSSQFPLLKKYICPKIARSDLSCNTLSNSSQRHR